MLRMKYSDLKNKSNKLDEGVEIKRNMFRTERLIRDQKHKSDISLKKQLNEEEIKLRLSDSKFSQSNQLHVKVSMYETL